MAIQPAPAISQAPSLQTFDDVVALIDQRRDIALRLDVQKYVRLISFRVGAISFEPAPGAPNNLSQRLSARLKEWTGQPWLVAAEGGGGAETLAERQAKADAAIRAIIGKILRSMSSELNGPTWRYRIWPVRSMT